MVLVKMLMEIALSRREVSPAEQLCRSPRLVPPRFRLVAAESRPERLLFIFFLIERLHIGEDGHRRATRGPTRYGGAPRGEGRAPHPREQGVGPLAFIFGDDFSLFILRYSVEFHDFWSYAE